MIYSIGPNSTHKEIDDFACKLHVDLYQVADKSHLEIHHRDSKGRLIKFEKIAYDDNENILYTTYPISNFYILKEIVKERLNINIDYKVLSDIEYELLFCKPKEINDKFNSFWFDFNNG